MKKFINEADDVVDEAMEGFTACYGNYYEKHPEVNAVILKEPRKDKVALVIGGGSGHEPMFNGSWAKASATRPPAAMCLPRRIRAPFMRLPWQLRAEKAFCSCTATMRGTI